MTSKERFASTMSAMALALPMSNGRQLTQPLLEMYWRVLADLSDEELELAATSIMRNPTRAVFFPTPAELLAAARPVSQADAMRSLAAVRRLAEYSPELGDTWSVTTIREKLGPAAAMAFQAIGGDAGMRELHAPANAPFARQRFALAYTDAVSRDARAALPAPAAAALPAEVRHLLGQIGSVPE